MAPIVTRYPLDPTGVSPNNKVEGEEHTLLARPIRAIAPSYGAFFTESLVVYEKNNPTPLVPNVDYYSAELYEVPTAKYGKEICSVIVITNSNVGSDIVIEYQALGGPWSYSQQAIIQMINNLDLDDRPVTWGDIIGKPTEFNPAHHLHDAGDVYGFEYIVAELERIYQAIIIGDSKSHDLIYAYIDSKDQEIYDYLNDNFVKKNSDDEGSIRINNGKAEIRVAGAWKQFWPPLWQ